jgi:flagellar basal body-associated protein FliL
MLCSCGQWSDLMVILSALGLVLLVAVVAVGAYWLVNNVNFKQTETEKEDEK